MEARVLHSGKRKEDMTNPAKQSVSWHNPILLELRFTDTGAVVKRIGYGRRWAAHQSQVWLMDDAGQKEKGFDNMGGKIRVEGEESSGRWGVPPENGKLP